MTAPTVVTVSLIDLEADFDASLLDPHERERAARYRSEHGRRRWAAARCGLRRELGRATGRDPSRLEFRVGAHGKPRLAFDGAPRFNLSHSESWGLLAICADREVGADIEVHSERTEIEKLAVRFFSAEESAALLRRAEPERRRSFFDLWSVKEAVLKCDGRGLGGLLLSSFTAEPGVVGVVDGRWWVSAVPAPAGYSASIALEGVAPAEMRSAAVRTA